MKKFFICLAILFTIGISVPSVANAGFVDNLVGRIGNWWDDAVDAGMDKVFGEGSGGPIPDGSFTLDGYQDDFSAEITAHTSVRSFIRNVLNFALSFLGIVAMAVLIFAGFMYVTSMGEDGQKDKAKNMILYAVIGILIILISYALVNTLITGIQKEAEANGGGAGSTASEAGSLIAGTQILVDASASGSGNMYSFPGGYVVEPQTEVTFSVLVPGYGNTANFSFDSKNTKTVASEITGFFQKMLTASAIDSVPAISSAGTGFAKIFWNFGQNDIVVGNSVTRKMFFEGWNIIQVHGETYDEKTFDASTRVFVGAGAVAKITASSLSPKPDTVVVFDGIGSSAPVGSIQSYHWECTPTGSTSASCPTEFSAAETQKVSAQFPDPGTYKISLSVDSTIGATSAPTELTISVGDATGSAALSQPDFSVPASVFKDQIVSFNATGGETDSVFVWTFPDGSTQNGRQVTFQFEITGANPVVLEAFDPEGDPVGVPVTKSVIVRSPGKPLAIAALDGADIFPQTQLEIFRDSAGSLDLSSLSLDEEGNLLDAQYISWAVNGQPVLPSQLPQLSTQMGTYTVRLTAVSPTNPNNRDELSFSVKVLNNAPEIDPSSISVSSDIALGKRIYRVKANATDSDGTLARWKFEVVEFGGPLVTQVLNSVTGTASETMETVVDLSSYSGSHDYTFRVTVFDNDNGQDTESYSEQMTLAPGETGGAPTVEIFPSPSTKGTTSTNFSFYVQATDPDGDFLTYKWEFPNGKKVAASSASHRFDVVGNHIVSLTVSDGENDVTATTIIEVIKDPTNIPVATGNTPPVVKIAGMSPGNAGDPTTLFSFFTEASDADGDALTYRWTMGDGTEMSVKNVAHQYENPGTYQAKVVVSDGIVERAAMTNVIVVAEGEVIPPNTAAVYEYHGSASLSESDVLIDSPKNNDISSFTEEIAYTRSKYVAELENATDPEERARVWKKMAITDEIQKKILELEETTDPAEQENKNAEITDLMNQLRELDDGFDVEFDLAMLDFTIRGTTNTTFFLYGKAPTEYPRPLSFSWDAGDDRIFRGQNASFRYLQPGLYFVTMTVTDGSTEAADSLKILVEDASISSEK
ncbi:PKD domain-containing protein [bacterium]|jgi:PKD repeat protein|nr:PKD domain-containing protein [bacterium]MBT6831970.1 PKD domain-containing protein [bacterium]MBT6996119.1 PKD domain-containing protein [bacterium]MBT7772654.1 PKD domain-containing protein [bacterium]